MPHRIILRRVGLRGEAMVLLGTVWVLMGLAILTGASSPADDLGLWHLRIAAPLRAASWIVAGLAAIAGAKWPAWSGYALGGLFVGPAIRGSSYLISWLVDLWPGPPDGHAHGWYTAAIMGALIGSVVFVAHIPAPCPAKRIGRKRGDE